MRKAKPAPNYPPEEGRYLRGNDFSPIAVVVTLNGDYENVPPAVENLVRIAVENGVALAGTLQTANVGIEKIVANVVANPNIRYLLVVGNEVKGHLAGEALCALLQQGIDQRRVIVETRAPTAYLFNIPVAAIERFRRQLTLVDLREETDPGVVREVVHACCQEQPTPFQRYSLYDPGAYPEPPISTKITWRITRPEEVEEWEIQGILKQIEGGK